MSHMYHSYGWRKLVNLWEAVIYNPVLDVETWWVPLVCVGVGGVVVYRNRAAWQRWHRSRQQHTQGGRDLSI